MFQRFEEELKKYRALLLCNLKSGIRDDLLRKIKEGTLTPPLDATAVSVEIFTAINSQSLWAGALSAIQVTSADIKVVLLQVCTENKIEIKEGTYGVN